MASIDKSKFQFVKRDDFASETIDAPAYSYWKSVMRQFFKKVNNCHVGHLDCYHFDELYLPNVFKI